MSFIVARPNRLIAEGAALVTIHLALLVACFICLAG